MLLGAGGGERARDGEEDGLLALSEVGDGRRLELPCGVEVGEGSLGELVTDGDGGGDGEAGGGGGGQAEEPGAAVGADLEG